MADAQPIQAVDRAVTLLELVAASESPRTVRELAVAAGLGRTTAYRLLATLERRGLVERDPESRGYGLGHLAMVIGAVGSNHTTLLRRARPMLARLNEEVSETVNLSVAAAGATIAVEQIDPPHPVRLINYVNVPLPLHCTSDGKVLLADLSQAELEEFLRAGLERRTERTITDPERLRAEIESVRANGFGVTLGELDEGINGVSVAVRDAGGRVAAMISVSGPAYRLTSEQLPRVADRLRAIAAQLEPQPAAQPSTPSGA